MTDTYFFVDIPYHRPAAPSPLRLLQRWSGPLLLGTVLAALAWHGDHPSLSAGSSSATPAAAPAAAEQTSSNLAGYNPAAGQRTLEDQPAAVAQAVPNGAHPSLVFHNCSIPHMDIKKDRNDLIAGVATVSSCDEAKVTLWDSSR